MVWHHRFTQGAKFAGFPSGNANSHAKAGFKIVVELNNNNWIQCWPDLSIQGSHVFQRFSSSSLMFDHVLNPILSTVKVEASLTANSENEQHSTSRPRWQLLNDNTMINLLLLLYALENVPFVFVTLTDGHLRQQKRLILNELLS